ncbi:MAG TPA: DnaB-like helicase C-terminal domain-containing protein, partial [Ardenticatenaceae bacterium]|nr:DnaB-like helicase C-terminal domain-containing protein [Ardenticatenaceae bacterium]
VRTRLGREVKTTLAHPFLTACGWRPLAKLQVGERVALPRELPVFGCEPLPRAELVLLAYLIGDGGLTESSPRFTTTSEYVLRDLEAHIASIGVTLSPDIRPGRAPSYRLVTPRGQPNPLIDLVKQHGLWGKLAIEKTIPAAIYRLPKEQLALFLNRLFATDGSVWISREYGRISYASSSKALAQGVQHLLLRFGLNAKLREKRVRYKDQMRLAYEVELMAAVDILRFAREIGIFGKEEPLGRLVTLYETKEPGWTRDTLPTEVWDAVIEAKGDLRWSEVSRRAGKPVSHNWHVGKRSPRRETVMQLAGALEAPELHTWAQANIYWDEIAAIEYVGEEQVYDLTVPVTHNFVAADVYVHNTAFSLSITEQVALKYGARVAYFSLEMGADQVVARMVSSQTGIDVQRLRVGPIYEEDLERVGLAVDVLGRTRIFIDESPNVSPLEMRTKARRVASEHGLDLIVVDYLQLMRSETRNDNRVQEISYISRALKGLARELHVPVLALSQLSRSVESRQDKRPMLSDLRESGSIEQDADVVAFIYRDEVYNKNTERPNIAELIVAKHRNGPTGTIELRFTRENAKFSNLETLLDEDQMGPINGNNGSLDDIVF